MRETRPTRRALMAAATASAAASLVPTRYALAQPRSEVHAFKVGAAEIVVISDGVMDLPTRLMLPEQETLEIGAVFKANGQTFSAAFRAEVNVAVIRTGKEVILVDTGGGPDFMPTLGKLYERLTVAGVKPEAVTKVVFTHAHPDHLWGVIDPLGGDTLFEQAEHVMSVSERDFWLQAGAETRVPEHFQGIAAGTRRRLAVIAARIITVKPGHEVVPGVELIDTSGHTPGHVSVVVRSGGEQLMIGSDVLTQHIISFAEPGWRWGPDMDADKAIASRRRTLDRLATDRMRLLGYHLPWPGLGNVERKGTSYRFIAD